MRSIDDLLPHEQAKIAAAMYLAAVTEPSTPRRSLLSISVSLLDLVIGYTTMLLLGAAWVFFTHAPLQWHAIPVIALLFVPATALFYAVLEFVWLLLVALVGQSLRRAVKVGRLPR